VSKFRPFLNLLTVPVSRGAPRILLQSDLLMATGKAQDRTEAEAAIVWLQRHAKKSTRDSMPRYGLPTENALGVPVNKIQELAKQLGRNHRLAAALWDTGCYEARLLASFVDEPAEVTPKQMDRWCRDFDNWGVCDTVCFKLFDRTPHAFAKVQQWHGRKEEFVKRAAFALLASLALHDKRASDESFLSCLPLIESAASDERNFVKKGVSWALRGVGRRNPELNAAAVKLALKLSDSSKTAEKWIGKDALRDLTRARKGREGFAQKLPS
jgi:3-methyladenine DNA glycosylase AlkD